MADIKISQLGAAQSVNDADVLPMTANGTTVKVSAEQLKEHAIGDTDISDIGDGTPTGAIAHLDENKANTDDLSDIADGNKVVLTDVADGDEMTYDATAEKWKNTSKIKSLTNRVRGNWSGSGKNKLPNNIYGTTTNNGVTVSRNDDGSLNISGTNTSSNVISISLSDAVWGSNTKGESWLIDDYLDRTQMYTMSISESDVNVRIRITFFDSSKEVISGSAIETRTHVNITIPSEAVYAIVRLAVNGSATVQANTVVYPMIRLASDTDDTYEPYAKTKKMGQ